jgi:SAM-dependent methyltransferase
MIICPDCFVKLDLDLDVKCSQCGWLADKDGGIVNMLSTSDRKDSFFRNYIDLYEKIAKSEISAPVNSDFYVKSMAKRTASLLGNIEKKNICDVGSGKGFLLQEILKKKPSKVTAIDISTKYLEKIDPSNVNRIVANAENLPFDEEFDVVISTDVIEHVLNVGSFMYGINKMLKEGGLFIVRAPYRENLLQYGRHSGSPYPFTHLRTYNVDLLKLQVEQAGFKPIKILFDGFQPAYPRFFFKFGIGAMIFKKLVTDRYPDYWSVTTISPQLGVALMKPVEVNMLCRKVKSLTIS